MNEGLGTFLRGSLARKQLDAMSAQASRLANRHQGDTEDEPP